MADDKRLERIEVKVDKISDHLGSIDATLSAQHESLKDHIRRTEVLEETILPIKKHVDMVKGAMALITLLGILFGILEYFKR